MTPKTPDPELPVRVFELHRTSPSNMTLVLIEGANPATENVHVIIARCEKVKAGGYVRFSRRDCLIHKGRRRSEQRCSLADFRVDVTKFVLDAVKLEQALKRPLESGSVTPEAKRRKTLGHHERILRPFSFLTTMLIPQQSPTQLLRSIIKMVLHLRKLGADL